MVSIIMPSLNVAPYIRQCIESVIAQTLKDIEIICVDAGSTDGTLEILQEYAQKDDRIQIIHSEKKSYGYQMNLGFDAAKGDYLGIIETDDYADLDMFETLYGIATEEDLDVVKGGFYNYYSKGEERNEPNPIASQSMCSRVFCPLTDFKSDIEQADFFNIKPTIWSAIYKKEFIRSNHIRFNETPGASFQDLSFTFKVWSLAKRVKLVERCFLHYRQDNEASSVNSPGKIFCVCDEYEEIQRFIDTVPEHRGRLEAIMCRMKYDSYNWNYIRLAPQLRERFLERASDELDNDIKAGKCEKKLYPAYKWETLLLMCEHPDEYHAWKTAELAGEEYDLKQHLQEKFSKKLKRKLIGGYWCYKEHGFRYTWNNLMEKIKRRMNKNERS